MKKKQKRPTNYIISITDTALERQPIVRFYCHSERTIAELGYMVGVLPAIKDLLGVRWGLSIRVMTVKPHKDIQFTTMVRTIANLKVKLEEFSKFGTSKMGCDVINLPANTPRGKHD